MYSKLPNLVLGFHGCEKKVADSVIRGESELNPSTNDYDWLGSGVYFWEQNYDRAMQWAVDSCRRHGGGEPAVVGAVIDLGYCLNLTDSHYIDLLKTEYDLMKAEFEMLDLPMPVNKGRTEDKLLRRLDCAVVEHLHARMASGDIPEHVTAFDSARGLFSEGSPIYPGAGFREKTHVQICVRNQNCIKGYFVPRVPVDGLRIP